MATLILFAVTLVSVIGMTVVLTYAASKVLKTENATWRTALATVAVIGVLNILFLVGIAWLKSSQGAGNLAELFLVIIGFGLTMWTYQYFYRAHGRKLLGFFGLQIVLVAVGFAITLPLRWYLAEAFVIPTNSMAPNISGHRLEGRCPECGGTVVMTVDDRPPPFPGMRRQPQTGTCIRCIKDWDETQFEGRVFSGDRIIAVKWNKPQRWDAIVFRYPPDPKINYIKRIVGMPGEEIVIGDDGFLIVDGNRVEPPAEFADLRYTNFHQDPMMRDRNGAPLWGTAERPMKLGPDEYFVLGDHTHRALDARFWGPVKRDAIIGTATMIYWPPSRWRIFK